MHLLVGKLRMESDDHEGAIRSFGRARAQMRQHTTRALVIISLVNIIARITQCIELNPFLTDIRMEI